MAQTHIRPTFKVMQLPMYLVGVDRRFVALAVVGFGAIRMVGGARLGTIWALLLGLAAGAVIYGVGWYTRHDPIWLPIVTRRLLGKVLGRDYARYDALSHRVFRVTVR